ncbi:Na+/H+ antiporter NhaC [Clostridium tetanomorphum]|uniref:Na+/H+ antiporter NhaC family protein n=2 Tax=Clostridium TaxID=1485 RepID=A0A923IZ96_CLOTT|nr:Na+/H+ antiporter NhaC family protein [Clostridium tetanomorphum]KAJ51394.1 Na+/H+ antiporter [Clostridium tetanomorphum DSM 665]MBC2396399.1 Na+/H+ antiporter NhaC family protein [Clostridium tetanomorphum]MBP1863371.1 Na+/H+ antiporter NhaC [Clostridium tetanomorphum]NRS83468.1 Na+/H+ antiporter NhaC [Clostridium tetanomorphum]NRZ96668.1 Na+/H+ antiporter NhaC [Clostridium tetanomorphum]
MEDKPKTSNGKALIPFFIFVAIYLGSGLILQVQGVEMAFYQLPAPVAIFCGIISAFFILKGNINDKFNALIEGCGNQDIIIMCTIYLLAGAFASVAKAMGGVDSTVNLGLTYIPAQYITVGLFIISCFISISTGTSVGTIVAVAPIAVGLAQKSGLSLPFTLAAVMGGAMFGDNLSVISDTTIAATRTQGCEMRDKFRVNIYIAAPAAIITIILLLIFGRPEAIPAMKSYDYNIIKVIPYLFVLILSLVGVNVFVVLTIGIVLAGIIGISYGNLTVLSFTQEIFNGFSGMIDIFLLSMFTGGLANMITKAGGIQFLLEKIQETIKGKKSAEFGIGALVALTDAAVANNTVAIIINGPIAKEMCYKYKVDPRRSASILDTFSCIMQGIIPYGAQMLILLSFTKGAVTPFQIIPLLWYQQLLLVSVIISIFIPFADGLIKKRPWDWSKKEEGNVQIPSDS